ncbi:MAG: hypothetical protein WCQ57_07195 [Verrucomicrobiota bacterium]
MPALLQTDFFSKSKLSLDALRVFLYATAEERAADLISAYKTRSGGEPGVCESASLLTGETLR